MSTFTATQFRSNLFGILRKTIQYNEPAHITTKDGDAVVLSESDYSALQETLYLVSAPGMRQTIMDGLATPLDACTIDNSEDW
ncbi:MAG: type II toxin-antitoxin system Phd/YefM family antitoxin [Coriobacteriales bacterium]|jgi:PHD/YefM family antitoxin component YafN of YafNO toxin-antitoxin module|nr:type II toxin-antitoxin system Phd/YefM family antitoxin [Coriobacteriales bacterium]